VVFDYNIYRRYLMEYGNDFNEEVKINKFKLEDESERHPNLYYFYSDLLDEAKWKKDEIEKKLEFVTAREELKIRKNPPKDVKITEGSIKALLVVNEEVVKLKDKLVEIKREVYHFKTAVEAIEQRNSRLKDLTSLYISGYFSKPSGHQKNTNTDNFQNEQRKNLRRRKE
jgi:tetrahydromethanopterin S-methyltransferase subunit G